MVKSLIPGLTKGLFIVLEGVDCAGKSSQGRLLAKAIESQGLPVLLTAEPTSGDIGMIIRKMLKEPKHLNVEKNYNRQLAYLFAADRHYHLHTEDSGILSSMAQGVNVISDRYYFSSLAYNCDNNDETRLVKELNVNFPLPNVVIFIDISVETAKARLKERDRENEHLEAEGRLNTAINKYKKMWHFDSGYPGQVIIVDGEQTEEQVHRDIIRELNQIKFELRAVA